jgi:enoyl-CoA hydratase
MTVEATIDRADQGDVRILTISNERRRNALSRAMAGALISEVTRAERDGVRGLVITGAGTTAFSAGADLKEMTNELQQGSFDPILPYVYDAITRTTCTTVAAVNGMAVGGGFELALACDARVAAPHAVFALPEATLGMVPRFGVQAIATLASTSVALDLALSGRTVGAVDGQSLGLVSGIEEDVLSAAVSLATSWSRSTPEAAAAIKELLLATPAVAPRDQPLRSIELSQRTSETRRAAVEAFAKRSRSEDARLERERQ